MTFRSFIIQDEAGQTGPEHIRVLTKTCMPLFACLICLAFLSSVHAQRIAILNPEKSPQTIQIVEKLALALSTSAAVVDNSLSEAAFLSEKPENPFNLSLEESKRIGLAIGCNAFLLVKAETLRRTSTTRTAYFESYAAVFVVSSRSGHLIAWRLANAEADNTSADSERRLLDAISKITVEISHDWKEWLGKDESPKPDPDFPEMPDAGSADAKSFRAPIPYLRIKPEYTDPAYLYDVKATVEVMVDLDEKGTIIRTEIARWAGFGLDEAVINAVRKMNWRPAERNGKTLPSRFLLRYNFKRIEKS